MIRKYADIMSEECERFVKVDWGLELTNDVGAFEKLLKEKIKPDCKQKREEKHLWEINGKTYLFPNPVLKDPRIKFWILDIEREGFLSLEEKEKLFKERNNLN